VAWAWAQQDLKQMAKKKKELIDSIKTLDRFCKRYDWRFGQAIWNIMATEDGSDGTYQTWEAPEANALFFISDDRLKKRIDILIRSE
jgi:hypothetical protein